MSEPRKHKVYPFPLTEEQADAVRALRFPMVEDRSVSLQESHKIACEQDQCVGFVADDDDDDPERVCPSSARDECHLPTDEIYCDWCGSPTVLRSGAVEVSDRDYRNDVPLGPCPVHDSYDCSCTQYLTYK